MRTQTIIFSLILFCILDALFIYLNYNVFSNQIIDVQRVVMIPKNLGVVAVYIILLFAFYYFVLRTRRPVYEAALLGGVIYAVYELTNYSLFKKWRLSTVALDTLWGATLWGLTAYITYEFF